MPKSRFSQQVRNKFNKKRSKGSTNSLSTSTALLSPKKPSTSFSSKSIKRRRITRTVADSEIERAAQKTRREEGGEEEDSESSRTPNNDSDSATTEKTNTKTKNGKTTPVEEKILKLSLEVKVQNCLAVYIN